jgi:ribosomal-protein-alanine N-acetyltransferase
VAIRQGTKKIARIEPMKMEDIDEVLEIEKSSFEDPWQRLAFESAVESRFSRSLVARGQDGKIVGYTVYWIAGPECHILNLAVHPEMRRKGLGSQIMDRILEDAKGFECEEVVLEVRRSNLPAIRLYQEYGFVPIGVRRRYYSNKEDAIVMSLDLVAFRDFTNDL